MVLEEQGAPGGAPGVVAKAKIYGFLHTCRGTRGAPGLETLGFYIANGQARHPSVKGGEGLRDEGDGGREAHPGSFYPPPGCPRGAPCALKQCKLPNITRGHPDYLP